MLKCVTVNCLTMVINAACQLPSKKLASITKGRCIFNVRNYLAELTDGSTLPVSKARYKMVRDRFAEYMGEL